MALELAFEIGRDHRVAPAQVAWSLGSGRHLLVGHVRHLLRETQEVVVDRWRDPHVFHLLGRLQRRQRLTVVYCLTHVHSFDFYPHKVDDDVELTLQVLLCLSGDLGYLL